MNTEAIKQAVMLEEKVGHVFVATADAAGLPHIAMARNMSFLPEGRVTVKAWFCQGTVSNMAASRSVSLVVWDPATDRGYQLIGMIENVDEVAMMDGYAPGRDDSSLPQTERRLLVRVDKVIKFTREAHVDREM